MKLITLIFLIIQLHCYGQRNFDSSYLGITQWSISFIKLNNNQMVTWYTKSCTNKGTTTTGKWNRNGDTLLIEINNKIKTFLLKNDRLCYIDENGVTTEEQNGLTKTNIRSIIRVNNKAKRIRKRK